MKKLLLLIALVSLSLGANAFEIPVSADTTKNEKYKLHVGGRIDAAAYGDSHKMITLSGGALPIAPSRPSFDPVSGADLNAVPSLGFEAATSRFNAGGSIIFNEKNSVDALVEVDFLNLTAGSPIIGLRLRHVYARLNLGNSSILFGQTSHLGMLVEASPNTVTFAAGAPINTLSRPIQFRFTQRFAENMSFDVALSMAAGAQYEMQKKAMTPDLAVRYTAGNPKGNIISVFAGYKSITPCLEVVENQKARMNAFYGGVTAKLIADEVMAIRAGAYYGGDMTTLGQIGGYAPTLDGKGYSALSTLSTWIDFSSMKYKGWEVGVFAGYQKNMGSQKEVMIDKLMSLGANMGIDSHWQVAPRVWYYYKSASFGAEYMYSEASWMKEIDNQYRSHTPMELSHNNRVTLLARFTF